MLQYGTLYVGERQATGIIPANIHKSLMKGGEKVLTLVQLADGCYKLVIDYSVGTFHVHREWTFTGLTESTADPMDHGEYVEIRLE